MADEVTAARVAEVARDLSGPGLPEGTVREWIAEGPGYYAEALRDPESWARYVAAVRVLSDGGERIEADKATVGALAWTLIRGRRFVAEVAKETAGPSTGGRQ